MALKKGQWVLIFFVVLAGGLLWVKITVSSVQMSYAIRDLETKIETEEKKQMRLKMERDSFLSLNAVETFSKTQLGLVPAQDKDLILIQTKSE